MLCVLLGHLLQLGGLREVAFTLWTALPATWLSDLGATVGLLAADCSCQEGVQFIVREGILPCPTGWLASLLADRALLSRIPLPRHGRPDLADDMVDILVVKPEDDVGMYRPLGGGR